VCVSVSVCEQFIYFLPCGIYLPRLLQIQRTLEYASVNRE